MQHVALGAEQLHHHAVMGRRDFHQRLGGLHRDQRLVGLHPLAGLDVPLTDLRFLQAFAEVGQLEVFHRGLLCLGVCRGHGPLLHGIREQARSYNVDAGLSFPRSRVRSDGRRRAHA
ncbi:hypothetical protein D3C81_1962730 [compost metagenome]